MLRLEKHSWSEEYSSEVSAFVNDVNHLRKYYKAILKVKSEKRHHSIQNYYAPFFSNLILLAQLIFDFIQDLGDKIQS